jgi:hypothetical protein
MIKLALEEKKSKVVRRSVLAYKSGRHFKKVCETLADGVMIIFQLLLLYCVLGREIDSRNGQKVCCVFNCHTGCLEEILTVVAVLVVFLN